MPHVKSAKLQATDPHGIDLSCNDGISCRVQVVTSHIFRVLFKRPSGLRQPRTWAVVPPPHSPETPPTSSEGPTDPPPPVVEWEYSRDCPVDGWDRLAVPFPTCPFQVSDNTAEVKVWTDSLTLLISLDPFSLQWYTAGSAECISRDRPSRPYHFSAETHRFSHSVARDEGDVYMGLGDKTGKLNLHGRRVKIGMRDALGYDPEAGDPLYKHWPFLVVRDGVTKQAYGVLYDNMAEASVDLGCEHSNYYGLYRTYEADDGDLDMYFILGPDVRGTVARMVGLIGGSALMPRWSLGFHCTAMPLADHPQAQQKMGEFIDECVRSHVPCSAFHFGSGYTSIGKRRYVFHWNRDKFPDPKALIHRFNESGMRVVANVKPCLLTDHPSYDHLSAKAGFVALSGDKAAGPAVSQFWDGEGSHVDFSNPEAVAWWRENLQRALLDLGICTAWNDNNEYEISEEGAVSHNFGSPLPLSVSTPLHALLMTRASFEQQLQAQPLLRPYSVTRAGYFGTQRYAQTWTGDNATNWRSLRWNLRMGLSLGLSGMFNIGHDVGGFSGPAPEPELLVRWVQAGLLHPRFIMNSWKADGTVTTPWMHPSVLPFTRWAIRLRYRLLPHLYSLLVEASLNHVPVLRPTFFEFPEDDRCWAESDDMLLGTSVLAAPVVDRGARQRTVYLPKGNSVEGWFDFFSEEFYSAGEEVTAAAPLSSIPLFVRAGAVIPMTSKSDDFSKLHDESSRVLRVFPKPGASCRTTSSFFEDEGLQKGSQPTVVNVLLEASPSAVTVTVSVEGLKALPYSVLGVSLPVADTRQLSLHVKGRYENLKLEKQNFVWHLPNEP